MVSREAEIRILAAGGTLDPRLRCGDNKGRDADHHTGHSRESGNPRIAMS